ncbi:MAG: acetyl-CoA carboxylase carboxyl transferase subunit alpha [Opitutae bacterium]|nr:acetyl-CoA carboxylase carboxyl transferase subunit alpha [Opitutae bacterium]
MEKKVHTLDFEKPLRDLESQLEELLESSRKSEVDPGRVSTAAKVIEAEIETAKRDIYSKLTPWQKIQISRHPNRPYTLDLVERVFDDFEELHGDRTFGEDSAMVGGPAKFDGSSIMLIGQQKGRDTEENLKRNFGCPNPEGYRKALRLMKMAEKFSMPVVALIDTPGAYPGVGAEERHVAEAIAVNIKEMVALQVPVVAIVIGEGGSGGALGIAVADQVLIFENAYYSVISPEGCAAILWKDRKHAADAAGALRLSPKDLLELGVVDAVLPEPLGGAHRDWDFTAESLRKALHLALDELRGLAPEQLLETRYAKFRGMGVFSE